jgi:hypothetical protein
VEGMMVVRIISVNLLKILKQSVTLQFRTPTLKHLEASNLTKNNSSTGVSEFDRIIYQRNSLELLQKNACEKFHDE